MDGSGHATLPRYFSIFWQLWWGVFNGKTLDRLFASSFLLKSCQSTSLFELNC